MEEKVLLEWKEAHADVYSKFKEDLEGQLQSKQSFRSAHEILIYPKIVVPLSPKNLRLWLKKHEMSITNRW